MDLSSQTAERGLGAGDPFLLPPSAPSDVKKTQPKWRGRSDRLLRSWVPGQGPKTEEGMVAPSPPPHPPPIPAADWRALTLEARTRTRESRDPPSARKRPSRPGLGPCNRVKPDRRCAEGKPQRGTGTPKVTPKGQHGGADALRPLIQPPGGRQHGTCEPCHGTAATVAFAVAAGLHLSSPRTLQEAGETPPSSSSPAVEDPFWDVAVYSRRPIMRSKLGGSLPLYSPNIRSK